MAAVNRAKSVRLQHEESSESEIELETARALQNAIFPSRNNTPVSISAECSNRSNFPLLFFVFFSLLFHVIYHHFLQTRALLLLLLILTHFLLFRSRDAAALLLRWNPVRLRSSGNGGLSDETNILISTMEAAFFPTARRQVGLLEGSSCKCVIASLSNSFPFPLSHIPANEFSFPINTRHLQAIGTHTRQRVEIFCFPFHFTTNIVELLSLSSASPREAYKCFQFVNKHMAFPNNFSNADFPVAVWCMLIRVRVSLFFGLSSGPLFLAHCWLCFLEREKIFVGKIHESKGKKRKTFPSYSDELCRVSPS